MGTFHKVTRRKEKLHLGGTKIRGQRDPEHPREERPSDELDAEALASPRLLCRRDACWEDKWDKTQHSPEIKSESVLPEAEAAQPDHPGGGGETATKVGKEERH